MFRLKPKSAFPQKAVTLLLVITFIFSDLSFACPSAFSQENLLASQTVFEQRIGDPQAEKFRQSILSEQSVLGTIITVGIYLLGDAEKNSKPLPLEHMQSVLFNEGKGMSSAIDLSHVGVQDGVVSIKYHDGAEACTIRIAANGSLAAKNMPGHEWRGASEKFTVKIEVHAPVIKSATGKPAFKESLRKPVAPASQSLPRILLIPSNVQDVRLERNRKSGVFAAPPLGLYRMKFFLEKKGVAIVDVFDPNLYDKEAGDTILAKLVGENKYDVVGFSVTHMNMENDLRMIWDLKKVVDRMPSGKPKPVFVAGGQEATNNYAEWFKYAPIDIMVLGYGETVFADMLKDFDRQRSFAPNSLRSVHGVVFKDGDDLRLNLARPIDVSSYEDITYENDPTGIIPYEAYWKYNGNIYDENNLRLRGATLRTIRLFTSSHCLNGCGFCSSSPFLPNATGAPMPVRSVSAIQILEMVKNAVNTHNADAIFFNDDDFLIGDQHGRNRAIDFCKLVVEAKNKGELPAGLKFYMQTKVNSLTRRQALDKGLVYKEVGEELAKAGFVMVALGVESFSDHLLSSPSLNKKCTAEAARAALDSIFEVGITPCVNLILLPPESTEDDLLTTIRDAVKYIRRGAQVSVQPSIFAFPGTPISQKPGYIYSTTTLDIPGQGKREFTKSMLPLDEKIRKVALSLEEECDRVLEKLKEDPRWDFEYSPQPVRGLIYFIASLNLLGRKNETQDLHSLIWEMIERDRRKLGGQGPDRKTELSNYSKKLLSLQSGSSDQRWAILDFLKNAERDAEYDALSVLVSAYEGRFFKDPDTSRYVHENRECILRAIENILFNYVEIGKNKLLPSDISILKRLSVSLASDAASREAERLLALLNYNLRITFPPLENNMLLDGNIVNLVPKGEIVSDPDEIAAEFKGKKVLIFETHHDDATFYLSSTIHDVIRPAAQEKDGVILVTAMSDPLGVTDEYVLSKARAEGKDAEKVTPERKAKIREEEGHAAADAMGVKYVDLRTPSRITARIDNGKLYSYYSRFGINEDYLLENVKKLIEKNRPDVVLFGLPKGSFHPEHRDVSRAVMTAVNSYSIDRVLQGKDKPGLYIYPQAGIGDEFRRYGISPNVVHYMPLEAHSRFYDGNEKVLNKLKCIELFKSQISRRPEYPLRISMLDTDRANDAAKRTIKRGAFAEVLLRVEMEPVSKFSVSEKLSVESVLSASKKNKDRYARIFIFDGNVFFETKDDFDILPVATGKSVNSFLSQNNVISIALDSSGAASGLQDKVRSDIESLVKILSSDDAAALAGLLASRDNGLFAEVFSADGAGKLPGGMKPLVWLDEMKMKMAHKPQVKVSIHQPGYHRYIGFFEKARESDIFVFGDNLQYAAQEWQNRQKVISGWLTVPIDTGHQKDTIKDKRISGGVAWQGEHWHKIKEAYSREPYFDKYGKFFEELYKRRWTSLNGLNEAMTRYMARKMGIETLLIRASYTGDVAGLKKADYIAATTRNVTDDIISKGKKHVVYISGRGAHYLDDIANGVPEKQKLFNSRIALDYQNYDPDIVRSREDVNPFMSGFEFLVSFGPGDVRDLKKRRRDGLVRKQLPVLVSFLSRSDEKEMGANRIVVPVSDDMEVATQCAALYSASYKQDTEVVLVKNWPRPGVEKVDSVIDAERATHFVVALTANGVNYSDIKVVDSVEDVKSTFLAGSSVLLLQSPLELRRSAIILKKHIGDVPFSARPAYKFDMRTVEDPEAFRETARICINELRWIQDNFKIDDRRYYTEFLPDEVHDAYNALFRYVRKSTAELFKEIRAYNSRDDMLTNSGFTNASFFPDGKGSAFLDNWGMSGIWWCNLLNAPDHPLFNRFLLRTVDAASKALYDRVSDDKMVNIDFINDISQIPPDARTDLEHLAAVSFARHTIYATPELSLKPRKVQEDILRKLIGTRTEDLPVSLVSTRRQPSSARSEREKPDIIVTQLAMVTTLRSKDYQHYKCSQKTEGIARSLVKLGYDSRYVPIEDDIGYKNFLEQYKDKKQDVVLISVYQIHRKDLEILHELVAKIKDMNPAAFVVIEGASTNMAKQFLAICPEIDMFVRVESDEVIKDVMRVKKKGVHLSDSDVYELSRSAMGGVFIRSQKSAVISRFDRSNISHDVSLPDPVRYMFDLWYSERGCPNECKFCRRDQGGVQRSVSADKRVEWLLDRLLMELDPSKPLSRDLLKEALKYQASGPETLEKHPKIKLREDTFVGREKVRILVVSENALSNQKLIKEFARQARELGLNKYFIFKVADTDMTSLLLRGEDGNQALEGGVDPQMIEALHSFGADFIGFGTENPSNKYLQWWKKSHSSAFPDGYTTDDIIAVNKALIESGVPPRNIRHNLVLSFPEAEELDVKNSMLLVFISPQYNSLPFYFANGWGNNRYDRTFDVAASFLSSIDHGQYGSTFNLEPENRVGSVDLAKYFYASAGAHEYMIRREFRFLKYIDERLPGWIKKFCQPTFYRYAQKRFLSENFSDIDVRRAIEAWRNPSETPEMKALGNIMERYCAYFPDARLLEVLFILKAHMVSLEKLSFIDYEDTLKRCEHLPLILERCGVGKLFSKGDGYMIPGSFYPSNSMECLRLARLAARLADRMAFYIPGSSEMDIVRSIVEEAVKYKETADARLAEIKKIVGARAGANNILNDIRAELETDEKKAKEIERQGYLTRVSYPDSQAFENLRHLYIYESDEELFNLVVGRMNEKRLDFPGAVRQLCSERLGLSGDDYSRYVMAVKEYEKYRIYYCEGGFISQLRDKDPARVSAAISALIERMKDENNPYIVRNVALLLNDLAKKKELFYYGLHIVDGDVIKKLHESLKEGSESAQDIFFTGPGLALTNVSLRNKQRTRMLKDGLEKMGGIWTLAPAQDAVCDKGDWISMRVDGQKVHLKGTRKYEMDAAKLYADKMHFFNNQKLFLQYIDNIARVSDKHRLKVIAEVSEFIAKVGDRPHARTSVLTAESLLYVLPIMKMVHENPELVTLFMARSVEPFYNAWWMMMNGFGRSAQVKNALFVKVGKRVRKNENLSTLMAKAINSFLSEEEAGKKVNDVAWAELESAANRHGLAEKLNEYLKNSCGIEGGMPSLKGRSRRELVKIFVGFKLPDADADSSDSAFPGYFKMARETKFPNLMREDIVQREAEKDGLPKEGDYATWRNAAGQEIGFCQSEDGFPVEDFKKAVQRKNNSLPNPLSQGAMRELSAGLDKIAGSKRTLLPIQRNTINNYLMIYGDTPMGSPLRGTFKHRMSPLLNVVLRDTEFARMLRGQQSGKPKVLFVDEATSSATTLYLCEMVVKAYCTASDYITANICQRTGDTMEVLQRHCVVDNVFSHGLWPLEDMNEIFHGLFFDMGARGRRFLTYRKLIERSWAKEAFVSPGLTRQALEADIAEMNKQIDLFIGDHEEAFKFVDKVKTIRHDAQIIKREMVKFIIQKPDRLREEIMNNYYICNSVAEVDDIGLYILRDGLQDFQLKGGATWIPAELKELYRKVKYADEALELEKYMARQREIALEYVEEWQRFIDGPLGEQVRKYLSGNMSFEDMEKVFYETYEGGPSNSYESKDIHFDSNGKPLYAAVKDGSGGLSVELMSREGLDEAERSSDESLKKAARESAEDLAKRIKSLERFLEANKAVQDDNVVEVCNIVRDVLKETREISGENQSELFDVVRSHVNNRRAEFINKGNALIAAISGKKEMDHKKLTAEIKDEVATSIAAAEKKGNSSGISGEAITAKAYLDKNIEQLEADSIVAALITLARRAKRDGQKLIIGFETDWIPGYNEKGLQYNALYQLIREVESLGDTLRSMGIDNVEIIHAPSTSLASSVLERAGKTGTGLSNVVVLTSEKTAESSSFDGLRNVGDRPRPFIAAVDTHDIEKYGKDNKDSSKQLNINILEMLSIALELAVGKDAGNLPIIECYDKRLRMVIFLPKIEVFDIERLKSIYGLQKTALQAA